MPRPREPPQSLAAGAACHGDGGTDMQSRGIQASLSWIGSCVREMGFSAEAIRRPLRGGEAGLDRSGKPASSPTGRGR